MMPKDHRLRRQSALITFSFMRTSLTNSFLEPTPRKRGAAISLNLSHAAADPLSVIVLTSIFGPKLAYSFTFQLLQTG